MTRQWPLMNETWKPPLCPTEYGMFYDKSSLFYAKETINYDCENKSGHLLQKRKYWTST